MGSGGVFRKISRAVYIISAVMMVISIALIALGALLKNELGIVGFFFVPLLSMIPLAVGLISQVIANLIEARQQDLETTSELPNNRKNKFWLAALIVVLGPILIYYAILLLGRLPSFSSGY